MSAMPFKQQLIDRRTVTAIGIVALVGVGLWASSVSPPRSPFRTRRATPYSEPLTLDAGIGAAVAVWQYRMRAYHRIKSLGAAASERFHMEADARRYLADAYRHKINHGSRDRYVEIFEDERDKEFAGGHAIYVDGWPFTPIELAVLRLQSS
jgi:hypothetical protein